jgi:hypothetical protein
MAVGTFAAQHDAGSVRRQQGRSRDAERAPQQQLGSRLAVLASSATAFRQHVGALAMTGAPNTGMTSKAATTRRAIIGSIG